jgi:hypothetical protein
MRDRIGDVVHGVWLGGMYERFGEGARLSVLDEDDKIYSLVQLQSGDVARVL